MQFADGSCHLVPAHGVADGGDGAQKQEGVYQYQVAHIAGRIDDLLRQKQRYQTVAVENVYLQLSGNHDAPVEAVAHIGHDDHNHYADDDTLLGQLAAQKLVALQRADCHDDAGQGCHITHLAQQNDAGYAEQGAYQRAYDAAYQVFLLVLLICSVSRRVLADLVVALVAEADGIACHVSCSGLPGLAAELTAIGKSFQLQHVQEENGFWKL